jgi:superfamily II DNA or RNA helicase
MKFRYDKENEEFIVSEATRTEYHQMKLWLTRKAKGYRFNPAFKMGVWSGDISYYRDGKINLGLWKEALKGCQEIGVPFIIENKEDFPINRETTLEKVEEFCKEFFKEHKYKNKDGQWVSFMPYEHQIHSAYKILKNRYCMAEIATSGGKSLIISIVIFYTLYHIKSDAKFLIIVPSITLVTQFYDNIIEYNYGVNTLEELKTKKIEEILDGKDLKYLPCNVKIEEVMSERPRKYSGKEDANVFIGTYQSLEKWPKSFFEQFHTIATDEAHGAKNNTITKILNKTFKHAYCRFGVSGTFPPDESCEILGIQSLLGPKITEVTATELKEKGIIAPMEIKSVIINHQDIEFNNRIKQIRKAGMGKEALEIEKNYIHLSDKRIDLIRKITLKFKENSLILFYTIEYGQKLLKYLSESIPDIEFYYIDGEVSGKKREEIKKLMEEKGDKVKILIASYGTLSTGVSIKNLHQLILADSFKSEQIVIQSIGRLLRLSERKERALIFDLVDVFDAFKYHNILYSQYKERVKFYNKRKYPYKEIKINL